MKIKVNLIAIWKLWRAVRKAMKERRDRAKEADSMKPFWKSKKFWYAVVGVVVVILSQTLGLPEEQVQKVLYLILTLIFGQGLADLGAYFGKGAKK